MAQRKPWVGWGVVNFKGHIIFPTLSVTRKDSIKWMLENLIGHTSWRQLRRQGFRAIRVKITEQH